MYKMSLMLSLWYCALSHSTAHLLQTSASRSWDCSSFPILSFEIQEMAGLLSTKIRFSGKEISLVFEFLQRSEAEFLFEEIFVRDEYIKVHYFAYFCSSSPWFRRIDCPIFSAGHIRSTAWRFHFRRRNCKYQYHRAPVLAFRQTPNAANLNLRCKRVWCWTSDLILVAIRYCLSLAALSVFNTDFKTKELNHNPTCCVWSCCKSNSLPSVLFTLKRFVCTASELLRQSKYRHCGVRACELLQFLRSQYKINRKYRRRIRNHCFFE